MRFPTAPDLNNLSDYLNWQCIHVLSNRKYHDFVTEQSLLPDKVWAFPCDAVQCAKRVYMYMDLYLYEYID